MVLIIPSHCPSTSPPRLTVQQAVSQKMSSDRTHYNKYSELEKTAHEARLHEATEKDLLRRSVGHLRELTEEELGRTQTAIVAEVRSAFLSLC